ncbi:MAG: hypothetical protein QM736_00445 [Vicinamibacterales bacterium]
MTRKEARSAPCVTSTVRVRQQPTSRRLRGTGLIPHESPKGEKAWRFIVKQRGDEAQAAILRVDGDTGALTGTWQDGRFILSHFDGSRPARMEVRPGADGTLEILQSGSNRDGKLIAYREDVARAKGLPEPSNYRTHTTARDPNEIFAFKFPDVNGTVLSNDDPKFKGKVVVAIVTGTWCPNCHDEAQYPGEAVQEVPRPGARDRGARLRGARAAGRAESRQGVRRQVRRRVDLPDRRRTGRDVGEGAAAREPQHLAGHRVRWT